MVGRAERIADLSCPSSGLQDPAAHLLVGLDKDYTTTQPGELWETYYAQRILSHFSPQGR